MKDEIVAPLQNLLRELHDLLVTFDNDQYTRPVPILSNASLAQHTRHVIEFITALMKGYETGLFSQIPGSLKSAIDFRITNSSAG